MQTTNTTEFRNHIAQYLSAVEEGEMVLIMRHGKPIAKLAPISSQDTIISWKEPALRLKIKGASLSNAILNERDES
jgi:prevent-host-death family protein